MRVGEGVKKSRARKVQGNGQEGYRAKGERGNDGERQVVQLRSMHIY